MQISIVFIFAAAFIAVNASGYQKNCDKDKNEEYRQCGTACPLTCEQREPVACTLQCVEGCFCPSGLLRDTISGRCVYPEDCPVDS